MIVLVIMEVGEGGAAGGGETVRCCRGGAATASVLESVLEGEFFGVGVVGVGVVLVGGRGGG